MHQNHVSVKPLSLDIKSFQKKENIIRRQNNRMRKSYIVNTNSKPEVVIDSPNSKKAKYTSTVSYLRPTEDN